MVVCGGTDIYAVGRKRRRSFRISLDLFGPSHIPSVCRADVIVDMGWRSVGGRAWGQTSVTAYFSLSINEISPVLVSTLFERTSEITDDWSLCLANA